MYMLSIISLTLLPAVFGGRSNKLPPCDCFDVSLAYGYPRTKSYGEICYKYEISKTGSYSKCRASLQYFILDAGDLSECGLSLSNIYKADIVTSADDINDVFVFGNSKTSGVKISQICDDDPESFTICFDDSQVGGTQDRGLIRLKDSNGVNDVCTVKATVPDFCGGVEPTEEPSPSPTTAKPTSAPTCINNPEDRRFSCECFNNDPSPFTNCPRIDCVFDFGTDGCTDLPSGGAGNIPDGNPIQCDLNASPDECVDVNGEECTNSPNSNSGCTPVSSRNGRNSFGCCKTPPVAVNDFATTEEPNSVTVNVLANDIELDGDTLTIIGNSATTMGGTVKQRNTAFTYTPPTDGCNDVAPDDDYLDTFTYTIEDDDGNESTATVTITVTCVREKPIARNDDVEINEDDRKVSLDPLANDSDPDGNNDDLVIKKIWDGPFLGVAKITEDGRDILYTPDDDVCSNNKGQCVVTDKLKYNIIDPLDDKLVSNVATVTIRIICNREAPKDLRSDGDVVDFSCQRRVGRRVYEGLSSVSCKSGETLVSCGIDGWHRVYGTYINPYDPNTCTVGQLTPTQTNNEPQDGTQPVAVCCTFPSDAIRSVSTVTSTYTEKNGVQVVTQCPSDAELTGCQVNYESGNINNIRGSYAGPLQNKNTPPAQANSCGGIDTMNQCVAEARSSASTVQGGAQCIETECGYELECVATGMFTTRHGFNGQCPDDYNLVSCNTYTRSETLDDWHYSSKGGCYIQQDDYKKMYANGICCKLIKTNENCKKNKRYYALNEPVNNDMDFIGVDQNKEPESVVVNDYTSYAVIGIITLLFNLIGYGLVHKFCLENKNDSNMYSFDNK